LRPVPSGSGEPQHSSASPARYTPRNPAAGLLDRVRQHRRHERPRGETRCRRPRRAAVSRACGAATTPSDAIHTPGDDQPQLGAERLLDVEHGGPSAPERESRPPARASQG